MLDPLTALSVAGNVIQLVDFGNKIVNHTLILSRDDGSRSTVVEELNIVTVELKGLCTKLEQSLRDGVLSSSESVGQQSLKKLCNASYMLATELLRKLDFIKAKGGKMQARCKDEGKCMDGKCGKWHSFMEAVKWAWKEDEILGLKKRLSAMREMMEMHVIISLRYIYPHCRCGLAH